MGNEKTDYRQNIFGTFAEKIAMWTGRPVAFIFALLFIIACFAAAPLIQYSREWEMVITIVPVVITFLLVFLIQNSQNKETLAVQLKLNELIRATEGAHTTMVNLEKLTEEELMILGHQYERLAKKARRQVKEGKTDQSILHMAPKISTAQSFRYSKKLNTKLKSPKRLG